MSKGHRGPDSDGTSPSWRNSTYGTRKNHWRRCKCLPEPRFGSVKTIDFATTVCQNYLWAPVTNASKGLRRVPLKILISMQLYAKMSLGFHVSAPQCFQRSPRCFQRNIRSPLKPLPSLQLYAKMSSPVFPKVPKGPPRIPRSPPQEPQDPFRLPEVPARGRTVPQVPPEEPSKPAPKDPQGSSSPTQNR